MQPGEQPTAAALPAPQGYFAEKLSLLANALSAALRSLGLVVQVKDDSHPVPAAAHQPLPMHASRQHPILQDLGATVDKALQDAAATSEPHTRHLLHDAMEEDRLARANPIHGEVFK